jgi:serine/threonine-protein kinase
MTMDLLAGETLSARLACVGRISPGEALPLLRDVSAGLAAVHQAGVVHRDLKTANVFLVHRHQSREQAVVMDFGLARGTAMQRGASRQQLIGTPTYMAPEQLVGDLATPASDVYAFGIVAFETLTGRLPFGERQDAARSLARLREQQPPPSAFAPDIDRRWDQLVAGCVSREPEQRFADGDELMLALDRLSKAPPLRRSWWARLMIPFCAV